MLRCSTGSPRRRRSQYDVALGPLLPAHSAPLPAAGDGAATAAVAALRTGAAAQRRITLSPPRTPAAEENAHVHSLEAGARRRVADVESWRPPAASSLASSSGVGSGGADAGVIAAWQPCPPADSRLEIIAEQPDCSCRLPGQALATARSERCSGDQPDSAAAGSYSQTGAPALRRVRSNTRRHSANCELAAAGAAAGRERPSRNSIDKSPLRVRAAFRLSKGPGGSSQHGSFKSDGSSLAGELLNGGGACGVDGAELHALVASARVLQHTDSRNSAYSVLSFSDESHIDPTEPLALYDGSSDSGAPLPLAQLLAPAAAGGRAEAAGGVAVPAPVSPPAAILTLEAAARKPVLQNAYVSIRDYAG